MTRVSGYSRESTTTEFFLEKCFIVKLAKEDLQSCKRHRSTSTLARLSFQGIIRPKTLLWREN